MSTTGFLGWLNIRGLECDLFCSDEIYSNCPTLVTLRIANVKRLIHSYLLGIDVLGQKLLIPSIPRGESVTKSFLHTFNRRGRHTLEFATINSPFPVNFFVRSIAIPMEIDITVFPTPVGTGPNPFMGHLTTGGELQQIDRGLEGEMRTISDYTGVEPFKQIHWRLSARHDWFKVKDLGATASEPVILDLAMNNGLPVEDVLSRATFLINSLIKRNRRVGLKVDDERVIPADTGRGHRL